ncbi:SDR family oxidoreductase [Pseudonocardia adelaidensis]|uniref:NAD(P)H-binding protein n=1 Tax=Pseudonocardia adelaidensis TaxID=648754 RepID=A0ABP9P9V9_9PSEU
MEEPILVTGGTGTVGREVVRLLRDAGSQPRVLSRQRGPGLVTGDLVTGAGIAEAVRDVGVVVHAATRPGRDVTGIRQLMAAARSTGAHPHVVLISIVGADRVPLPYYRERCAVEDAVAGSGLPWTVQRSTQFHALLDRLLGIAARLPVLPVPAGTDVQPIDEREVAARLVALAGAEPVGRAPDLGGPEVLPFADLARTWLAARRRRRPVLPVRVPGRVARGYRDGGHLTPGHAEGGVTFASYLAERNRSAAWR